MRTGRPKKYKKNMNITVSMEENKIEEIDSLRGNISRGEYISILSISDNQKTNQIIHLKSENELLLRKLSEFQKGNESNIQAFQKTIYSHFKTRFKEKLEEIPISSKKFWAEKIGCKPQELINYL